MANIHKDLFSNVQVDQVEIAATKTATATSDTIDMQGYSALNVIFDIGNSGDTLGAALYWTLTLTESDTSDSGFAAVTDTDKIQAASKGTLVEAASILINAPTEDSGTFELAYLGTERYVRAVATATGTHTNGTPMGIVAVKAGAHVVKTK